MVPGKGGPGEAVPLGIETVFNERYRIIKSIGRGGFSFVYLCESLRTGKLFAIKEAFPSEGARREADGTLTSIDPWMTANARQALLLEMVAIARAQHRNVVRLEDSFEANKTLCFAMEFITGEPLSSLIDHQRGASIATASIIARNILDALDHIHKNVMIHGDVKPGNIILRADKTPVLIDFGCAVRISDPSSFPVTYTPGYSAPERMSERSELGPWSDIYSLCATMLTLLTGVRPPSDGSAAPWSIATFPRAANTSEERRLRHWLLAGISANPSDRPQTVAELREELKLPSLHNEPIQDAAQQYSVFISYSRRDSDRVETIVRALQEAGINPWIDRIGISPGEVWGGEIVRALRDSKLVLVLCSRSSMESKNVALEIYKADQEKKAIIPILLEEVKISDNIALILEPKQQIDFRNGGPAQVVAAVKEMLMRQQRAAQAEAHNLSGAIDVGGLACAKAP